MYDFDLFVIGGGSGGVRAARWASSKGAKVALCESDAMGGTCVVRGCIPKKLMSYAAHLKHNLKVMQSYGWKNISADFDWPQFKANRDKEIKRLSSLYGEILEKNDIYFEQGVGQVIDKNTVVVNGKKYSSKFIIIATGGKPTLPKNIKGVEFGISSNDIFHLKEFPRNLVVVGTGYIGLEFASIFNGLGANVHILCRKKLPLSGFDQDIQHFVKNQMQANGIQFHYETEINEIRREENNLSLKLSNGSNLENIDQVLFATGRIPNSEGLFSADFEIELNKNGAIEVDERSCTSVSNIYAVGDVTDRLNLTPVALEEAMLVVEYLFCDVKKILNYKNIATAVFCEPQIATVGISESAAISQGYNFEVYTSEFKPLKFTLGEFNKRSFMKMIVNKENDLILGAHMAGDDAAEMMQAISIAIQAGATKNDFDNTIGIHPTSAEEWTTLRVPRDSQK